jgi:quercetin dioxygenase-like cupin family protein
VGIFRIHTGEDGKSHIEEQNLKSHPDLVSPRTAKSFYLREFAAGTFLDWHPAPRRQVVIVLSGELENGFRDGSVHRFGPGDTRIIEDTAGEGHTTRVVGDAPCLVAVVPLGDVT